MPLHLGVAIRGRKTWGITGAVVGVAALALAVAKPDTWLLSFGVALAALLVGATALSHANAIAVSLVPLIGTRVSVRVWGQALEGGSVGLKIAAIRAAGAGLLIYLQETAVGREQLLKVAQPSKATIEATLVAIESAAYVSWGGKKLQQAAGVPALATRPKRQKSVQRSHAAGCEQREIPIARSTAAAA